MSSNIHLFVERKVEGKWECQLFKHEAYPDPVKYWYLHRNYLFFSLLAGVRGPFIPIVPPRGLPEDLSVGIKEVWDEDERGGDHVPSYYSLAELLVAQDTKERFVGYVDMKNYKSFKKNGKPDAWDMEPTKGTKLISNQEMDRIQKLMAFWDGPPPYTEITWDGTYKEIGKNFWEGTIPAMQALDTDPENVRCVFWFDI